jgi:DNA-binding CsgD family transcriptional regulator/tetratricopeptide (TPR) repeat protein
MASPSLFGRETELGVFDDLVGRLAEGHGGALVLRSEPGLGKSALLTAFTGEGRSRGLLVLTAAGVESETQLAFAGLHQLLQPLLAGVDDLPGPHRDALKSAFGMTVRAAPELFLIALATLELLADAAARTPVLIIADDVHWIDRPSLDVLAFVARRVSLEPIVVIMATREDPASDFVSAGLPELRLEPLGEPAAAALLQARAPDLTAEVRDEVLAAAGGNPLAIEELPTTVGPGEHPEVALPGSRLPLTARLEQAFASRTFELPAATRTVLLVAAADDGGVLTEVLTAAALVTETPLWEEALEPAISMRLVELDQDRLFFRHPLVRSAIYQAATVSQRRAAHAALAAVLEARPGRSIWHRAAAVTGSDETLASELEASAVDARRRGAISVAVAALQRAAELTNAPARRAGLLLQAAELGLELGRRDLVVGLLRGVEPLPLKRPGVVRMWWIKEMVQPGILGDSSALRSLIEVAEDTSLGDPDLALDLLWLAASRCFWGDPGQEIQELIVAAAERMGPADKDPRLLGALAYAAPIERSRFVREALLSSAAGSGDVVADRLLGSAAIAVGAFDLALPFLAAATAGLRTAGRLGHLPRVLVQQAWAAIQTGDLTVAVPAAEEAARLAAETNDALWAAGARIDNAMLAALHGDTERVETLVAEMAQTAAPIGARFMLAVAQLIRGVAALGAGRHDEAYDHLKRMFDPGDPTSHHFIRLWALGELAEAAAHSGNEAEARALIAELQPILDPIPSPIVQIGVRFANAVLADDRDAESFFQTALSADLSRWPFARGRLLLAYGSWLRRQRRAAESRVPLRAARDHFDAIGAIPWGERVRQELRASGESTRRRTPGAREQLTPQELQIARMAAEGLTNREIGQQLYLSHRTVGSHLYRIFPKLEITSRAQLRAVLDRGIASPA